MTERWTFTEESTPVPSATITLVGGATFTICEQGGDISARGVEGLFVGDTRICSMLRLAIDGRVVEPLTVAVNAPFAATFVGRTRDRALLVLRDAWIGDGMRLDLRIRNLTNERSSPDVQLVLGADLADLFAVKEGRADSHAVACTAEDGMLRFATVDDRRGLIARSKSATAGTDGTLRWLPQIQPGDEWSTCVELSTLRGGEELAPRYRCGQPPALAAPTRRQLDWQEALPQLDTDVAGLGEGFERAGTDLGGLRLFDPDHPDEPLIAAGAPWFMTLFGRDSILTSWMALLIDPSLGLATVRALARLQGTKDVPATEEEPGRILHEVRFSRGPSLALADGDVYYGSADSTPLFVMLVHELWRWGTPLAELQSVLPAVDAALDWLAGPGDPDGDGYVEYMAKTPTSLVNQGWKDSFDGVSFADGSLPHAPIALAEVQAYAFAAWQAGAALALAVGDHVAAAERGSRADELAAAFDRDFWMPERRAFAIALDRDKRQVDAVASNMGHCLWAGIVTDPDKAGEVAKWLLSPELLNGWGVRTLASSMGRYNPLSYHNGSVWPHDTAICAAGLRRAGFGQEAASVCASLLGAARMTGGRLPELFAGLSSDEVPVPVPYPASCSPQAWAAASPLLVARTLLGLEPDVPGGSVQIDPILPSGATRLAIVDLPLAGTRCTIGVDGDAVAVRGLPRGLALIRPGD